MTSSQPILRICTTTHLLTWMHLHALTQSVKFQTSHLPEGRSWNWWIQYFFAIYTSCYAHKKMCIPCLSYCTNGHKIHNLSDQWYHVFPVDVGFFQQTMSNYQRASLILKCLRPQWVGSTSGWTRLGALQFTRDRDVYIHVELCRIHIQYFHLRP